MRAAGQPEQVEVPSMTKLRPYLIALTILAAGLAPALAPAFDSRSFGSSPAFAAVTMATAAQNDDDDDDDDDDNNNNDNVNNNNDNVNNNNDNSNNNNANSNNNNGNVNDNANPIDEVLPPSQRSSAPAAAPVCSTPGQDMTFTSGDGRVQVKVFPSLSQSVKFSIRLPIDAASVPPAPGQAVGDLLFQLIAEGCDGGPIAVLPAEVNLGVHYADANAAGLNEQNFTLARLDTSANQWRQVAKQATDPSSNFSSATITEMGFYVLYQRS
jgi:hypothetical protein